MCVGNKMNTIKEIATSTYIIQKSKFIAVLIPLQKKEEINSHIDNLKEEYPKANHYCYAYRINGLEKCSDDKEPSKTAGYPILNVLKNNNLDCILCVVIRYFGGIKLGAGGLVRAYTNATTEVLKKACIVPIQKMYQIHIIFPYENENKVRYLLKDVKILNQEYSNQVHYTFLWTQDQYKKTKEALNAFVLQLEII